MVSECTCLLACLAAPVHSARRALRITHCGFQFDNGVADETMQATLAATQTALTGPGGVFLC
jgi:hypothetical protein